MSQRCVIPTNMDHTENLVFCCFFCLFWRECVKTHSFGNLGLVVCVVLVQTLSRPCPLHGKEGREGGGGERGGFLVDIAAGHRYRLVAKRQKTSSCTQWEHNAIELRLCSTVQGQIQGGPGDPPSPPPPPPPPPPFFPVQIEKILLDPTPPPPPPPPL